MIHGEFREGFPRIVLEIRLDSGEERAIEFKPDSGFEGDLALPTNLLVGVDALYVREYPFALADYTFRTRPVYKVEIDWNGQAKVTEVIAMDGNPLLGIGLLRGSAVEMEIDVGGQVSIGPLG